MSESSDFLRFDQLAPEFYSCLRFREDLSKSTKNTYIRRFSQFLKYVEENKDSFPQVVTEVNHYHIKHYLFTHLKEERGLADNTRFIQWVTLRHFFKWLAEEEPTLLRNNPIDKVPAPQIKKVKRTKVPTQEDMNKLLTLLEKMKGDSFTERRNAALILLYIATGARVSELNVPVTAVDTQLRSIKIRGKGDVYHAIPFDEFTAIAVRRYLRSRKLFIQNAKDKYKKGLRMSPINEEMLFISYKGPMSYAGMRYILQSTCKQAGIEELHFHQLRAFFVHTWLRNQATLDGLLAHMGWTRNSRMPFLYAEELREVRATEEYHNSSLSPVLKLREKKERSE